MSEVFNEPHSTKQWEDGVGYGLETDAETLLHTVAGIVAAHRVEAETVCRAVRCPVLVVHGERDEIVPYAVRRPGRGVDRRHARHRVGRRARHADA